LKFIYAISPLESVYAINLDELRQPEITFRVAWKDDDWMGCGAFSALSTVFPASQIVYAEMI